MYGQHAPFQDDQREADTSKTTPNRLTDRILLIRHGRPETAAARWIDHDRYVEFARAYEQVRLHAESRPASTLVALAQECSFVVHSHLPRALESVDRLGLGCRAREERRDFAEVDIPLPPRLPGRLPMTAWYVARRLLWRLDLGLGEGWSAASRRAANAAAHLETLAGEHGRVVFVGHGLFNGLISRALRRSGWSGPVCRGWPCWGWETLERASRAASEGRSR